MTIEEAIKSVKYWIGQAPISAVFAEIPVKAIEKLLETVQTRQPRVMALEEVRDKAEYMFLEKHSATGSDLYGCAIRGDWDGYGMELLLGVDDSAREKWENYGKTWRCWTARPTDKQRKEVPWNEGRN